MKDEAPKTRSEKEVLMDIIAAIDSGDDTALLEFIAEFERNFGELPDVNQKEVAGENVDSAVKVSGKRKLPPLMGA